MSQHKPPLRYTLLSDGSSDQALMPVLSWLLQEHGIQRAIVPLWADLRRLPRPPRGLTQRIALAVDLYPCDLLFVHRDAENAPRAQRENEIRRAADDAITRPLPPIICVVPIRMHEAWLLFDEAAIRRAAENPHGTQPLDLPRLRDVEHMPDPKAVLRNLVREASGLHGRRLQKLRTSTQRIAELINDFAPLRALSAFQALEQQLADVIAQNNWR